MFKVWLLYFFAQRARARGDYSPKTLHLYRQIFKQAKNTNVRFSYIRYLRFLGYNLDINDFSFVRSNIKEMSSLNQRIALSLILESTSDFDLTSLLDKALLAKYATQSPPIAAFLINKGFEQLPADTQLLASFFNNQKSWEIEFESYIKNNTVCIVGNSSSLLENTLGESIDKHGIVIRFNDYCADKNLYERCGKNIDIWVKSPDFKKPDRLDVGVKWTVISGPDVCYTMSDWSHIKLILKSGGKVITPPLNVWKELVGILQAPPSAGILMILWFVKILGSETGLTVTGFQSLSTDKVEQYHYSSPAHKAGGRHNWVGERKLLEKWQKKGMVFLDEDVSSS